MLGGCVYCVRVPGSMCAQCACACACACVCSRARACEPECLRARVNTHVRVRAMHARERMRNTGADDRANFSASKLACVAGVHMNRAVGLPSAVSGAATSE